ncbi:mannose-1-phosphate guanylyltransferase [Nocardioides sp.]|uniref:mannose-1-phosphate guanylyltransferase n=1 Tax=Nocardioides sp. TaxID=35761 RepID=UPI003D143708
MRVNAAPIPGFWAVVPAGGAGTRLWPLSRAENPKFLHDLTGSGASLLQDTVTRLTPLVAQRCLVVTGAAHRDRVLSQLPHVPADQVLGEPSPRDSMAAIGLAAALLEVREPDAVLGSFAADHVITDLPAFEAAVRRSVEVARAGWLVTIGIEPTGPATGFGYIHQGPELPGHDGAREVLDFVEKPTAEVASAYLASGDYRWNAGMFVVRPGVLLDLLAENHPELAAGLRAIASGEQDLTRAWPGLSRIAIDHAVAEPAAARGRVATVPGSFGWEDVGDFAALGDLLPAQDSGLRVLGDPALVRGVDASGLVVAAGGRTIAVVGLDDVVVVDTGDALLVTTRARAQDVKQVVEALRLEGRADLS